MVLTPAYPGTPSQIQVSFTLEKPIQNQSAVVIQLPPFVRADNLTLDSVILPPGTTAAKLSIEGSFVTVSGLRFAGKTSVYKHK